jgi:hypothetical protein
VLVVRVVWIKQDAERLQRFGREVATVMLECGYMEEALG